MYEVNCVVQLRDGTQFESGTAYTTLVRYYGQVKLGEKHEDNKGLLHFETSSGRVAVHPDAVAAIIEHKG